MRRSANSKRIKPPETAARCGMGGEAFSKSPSARQQNTVPSCGFADRGAAGTAFA